MCAYPRVRGELGYELFVCRLDAERHARRAIGDDEALQAFGLPCRMASREHPAPRLPEYNILVLNAEVAQEVVELVQEQFLRPERACVSSFLRQMRRLPITQLVVEYDWDRVLRPEVDEREDVVVSGSGSSM